MQDTTSVSVAILGSGGAGALTVGSMLFECAAALGCYGILTRSVGPQIRGGEAASLLRLCNRPAECLDDRFDVLLAMDWKNADRHGSEIPLGADSIVVADPAAGDIPPVYGASGAQICYLPLGELAKQVPGARTNMVVLGALAAMLELPPETLHTAMDRQLGSKGSQVMQNSAAAVEVGRKAADPLNRRPLPVDGAGPRWMITGNESMGLGALRGGVRFVAAYPITPATELLEWLSGAISDTGGRLIQAEDELASANMAIGASFGGIPALTATSGPGLSLMMESIGLAVAAEIPMVVVDVMRIGPSTGIPTKSEQGDLNIAIYGLHGDAPHLVLAPMSVADCLFTGQWAVHLAEAMQVPAIVLSDQFMGQARSIIDAPADIPFRARRSTTEWTDAYQRYAVTESGISPMVIPGTPGGHYTADGLEHTGNGLPSTRAADHAAQLDKRLGKIAAFDYGDHWARIEGDGALAIITWGSVSGAVREALARLRTEGIGNFRLITMRLLSPVLPGRMDAALAGVERVLVMEQNHSGQFYHYLRAHFDLPPRTECWHRPGPAMFLPGELTDVIRNWSQA